MGLLGTGQAHDTERVTSTRNEPKIKLVLVNGGTGTKGAPSGYRPAQQASETSLGVNSSKQKKGCDSAAVNPTISRTRWFSTQTTLGTGKISKTSATERYNYVAIQRHSKWT